MSITIKIIDKLNRGKTPMIKSKITITLYEIIIFNRVLPTNVLFRLVRSFHRETPAGMPYLPREHIQLRSNTL